VTFVGTKLDLFLSIDHPVDSIQEPGILTSTAISTAYDLTHLYRLCLKSGGKCAVNQNNQWRLHHMNRRIRSAL
jgi:hypothetical protein